MQGFGPGQPHPPRRPGGKPGSIAKAQAKQAHQGFAFSAGPSGYGAPYPYPYSPGVGPGAPRWPAPGPAVFSPRPFTQTYGSPAAGKPSSNEMNINTNSDGAGASPGNQSGVAFGKPSPVQQPLYLDWYENTSSQGLGAGAGAGAGSEPEASEQWRKLAENFPPQEISIPEVPLAPEPYRNATILQSLIDTKNFNLFFVFTHGKLIPDSDKYKRYKFTVPDDTIVLQTGAGSSFGCVTITSLDKEFTPLFSAQQISSSLSFLLGLEGASTGGHRYLKNFIFATPRDSTLNKVLTLDQGDLYSRKFKQYWGIYEPNIYGTLQPNDDLTTFVLEQTETKGFTTEEEVANQIHSSNPGKLSILIFLNCIVGREGEEYSHSYNLAQKTTQYSRPISYQQQTTVNKGPKSSVLYPPPVQSPLEIHYGTGSAQQHWQEPKDPKYLTPEEIEEQSTRPTPKPTKKYHKIVSEETANYIRKQFDEGFLTPEEISLFSSVGILEGGKRRSKTKRAKRRGLTRRQKKRGSK